MMNIPFKLYNNYLQTMEEHKDQGTALSSLYKRVTIDRELLDDYDVLTKSRLGEMVVVPREVVERWYRDYYRKEVFFQSIGLDPMGLEEYLESEGITLDVGKRDYPTGLVDTMLYFSRLIDVDGEEYYASGATPMESILNALTNMIARRGMNEVRERFWTNIWVAPRGGEASRLYQEYQSRQPEITRAFRVQSQEITDRNTQTALHRTL